MTTEPSATQERLNLFPHLMDQIGEAAQKTVVEIATLRAKLDEATRALQVREAEVTKARDTLASYKAEVGPMVDAMKAELATLKGEAPAPKTRTRRA